MSLRVPEKLEKEENQEHEEETVEYWCFKNT